LTFLTFSGRSSLIRRTRYSRGRLLRMRVLTRYPDVLASPTIAEKTQT